MVRHNDQRHVAALGHGTWVTGLTSNRHINERPDSRSIVVAPIWIVAKWDSMTRRRKRPPVAVAILTVVLCLWLILSLLRGGGPRATVGWDAKVSTTSHSNGKDNHHHHKKIGPIIVVLPGPHKTGSTSIQAALYQWFHHDDSNRNSTTGGVWSYPVPTPSEMEAIGFSTRSLEGGRKGFAPMVTRLFANPEWNEEEVIRRSALLQLYQRKIRQSWEQGKNVVIASEHLDRLVRPDFHVTETKPTAKEGHTRTSLTPEALWKRFLALLPSTSNLVVGLTHRTPRIEHLLSVWHHVGHESLSEFITKRKPPGLTFTQHSLDSLGLADFFVRQGYMVRVLDSGALRHEATSGADLPSAVACHVLEIPEFCGPTIYSTPVYNARREPAARNVNNQTLDAIEALLLQHDCQYQHLKVEWTNSNQTFATCRTIPTNAKRRQHHRPFSETIKAIIDMVCEYHPTSHCESK